MMYSTNILMLPLIILVWAIDTYLFLVSLRWIAGRMYPNSIIAQRLTPMTDPLPITPFTQKLDHSIQLPGSKSITNRALILAALAEGETRLEGALFSRDTRIMLEALAALGFQCSADQTAKNITVKGEGGRIPNTSAELHVGIRKLLHREHYRQPLFALLSF